MTQYGTSPRPQSSQLSQLSRIRLTMLLDKWMTYYFKELHCVPLHKLLLPGSHDSGAYQILTSVQLCASGTLCALLRAALGMAPCVVRAWTCTQNLDVASQLSAGIRCAFQVFKIGGTAHTSQSKRHAHPPNTDPLIWHAASLALVSPQTSFRTQVFHITTPFAADIFPMHDWPGSWTCAYRGL